MKIPHFERFFCVFSVLFLSHFSALCQQTMLGLTTYGGSSGSGAIFSYNDQTGVNVRYSFTASAPGSGPVGKMAKAPGYLLYGVTSHGGAYGNGVLYQFNYQTKEYIVLHDFTEYGPLGVAYFSSGKLYGYTYGYTAGGLFEFDLSTKTYRVLHTFSNATGSGPAGEPLEGPNGKLYGVTTYGGGDPLYYDYGKGMLFEYDLTTDQYTVKQKLTSTTGANPSKGLMLASNGKMYGLTTKGGLGYGTIFEYDFVNDTLNAKINFGYDPYTNVYNEGKGLMGPMVEHPNGKFYGNASAGGSWNLGGIFEYDPTANKYKWLGDFSPGFTATAPVGGLCVASDGSVYGLTALTYATTANIGFLYAYDPSTGKFRMPIDALGTSTSPFVQGDDGKLYSVFTSGDGNIFSYTLGRSDYQMEIDFNYFPQGTAPTGALTQALNGKFYGITTWGGNTNTDSGTLFEFDESTNTYKVKHYFDWRTRYGPAGGLTLHPNGNLYGVTSKGGEAIYEYSTSADSIINFYPLSNGYFGINGRLTVARNGKIYGLATIGGKNYGGVLFEFDPVTKTFSKKFDFANSSSPMGSLLCASNGKLFGYTQFGGMSSTGQDYGTLFEFDLEKNAYKKIIDFESTVAMNPNNDLVESQSGTLYGNSAVGVLAYRPADNSIKSYPYSIPFQPNNFKFISFVEQQPSVFYGLFPNTIMKFDISAGDPGLTNYVTLFPGYTTNMERQVGLTLVKTSQSIVQNPTDMTMIHGDRFKFVATATSGLPVQLSSSDNSIVQIVGDTLVAMAAGSVTISMVQIGNSSYLPAPLKTFNVQVNKADQVITFDLIQDKIMGDLPFALTATSTSGLAVQLTSSSSNITIDGAVVSIVAAGPVTIEASQPGDSGFNAAQNQAQTFCVNPTKPSIINPQFTDKGILLTSSASAGNQWYRNGEVIEGATNNTYEALQPGTYTVSVDIGGCKSEISNEQVLIATATENDRFEKIILFPNPSERWINLQADKYYQKINQVRIRDSFGEILQEISSAPNPAVIDINHLSAGIYILEIELDSKIYFERFVRK